MNTYEIPHKPLRIALFSLIRCFAARQGPHLALEDARHGLRRPCVMDLKVTLACAEQALLVGVHSSSLYVVLKQIILSGWPAVLHTASRYRRSIGIDGHTCRF